MAKKTVGDNPGELRSDNVIKMKFCWCPPGMFRMGSPKTENSGSSVEDQVAVTLTHGFWMSTFEVTQEQYKLVMGTSPSGFKGASLPVEKVTWKEATEFCEKMTVMDREARQLPNGWEYRLPTEAQWEYACRAGTNTAYSFGNEADDLGDYGWYKVNSDRRTHPVGQKKPNPWGLYDMHGNIWEWCRDNIQAELPGGTDPCVTNRNSGRVMRGGCFVFREYACRSAFRGYFEPEQRYVGLGFRVASVRINQPNTE